MDTVYVIEQEFETVGICDNELDVLRCLVLHGMIDLEKVNKELQAHNQPDYKDVVTWLAHGATIDDLSQFIENGTCYSQTINHDLGKQCSFDYLCKQEFNLNEYVVRFPDEHEFIVKATFLDEAKALALKERDEAGFDYELPKSVSFLPGRLSIEEVFGIKDVYFAEKKINMDSSVVVSQWGIDDVKSYASEFKDLQLSDDACRVVLHTMENKFDASKGYTWDAVNAAISLASENDFKATHIYNASDVILDEWYVEDVQKVIEDMDCTFSPELSDRECIAVLKEAKRRFDKYGIGCTWKVLEDIVSDMYKERTTEQGLCMVNVEARPYTVQCGTIFVPASLRNDQEGLEEYCENHFGDVVFTEPKYDYKGTDITYNVIETPSLEGIPSKNGELYPGTKEQLEGIIRDRNIPLSMVNINCMDDVLGMKKAFQARGNMVGIESWNNTVTGAKGLVMQEKMRKLISMMANTYKSFKAEGISNKKFLEAARSVIPQGEAREMRRER